MIGASASGVQVWLATQPVDMRKSFDGLAEVVRAFLGHDPLSGNLFVFRSTELAEVRNRSAQRVKILWWDRDGLAIYYKRPAHAAPFGPGDRRPANRLTGRKSFSSSLRNWSGAIEKRWLERAACFASKNFPTIRSCSSACSSNANSSSPGAKR